MKIKSGFLLRKVSDVYVVVAVGEASKVFGGMISLNETGAFLWEKLANGCKDKDELLGLLLEEYEVSEAVAKKDIDTFIEKLNASSLLEN